MAQFVLTEEQYMQAIKEGVLSNQPETKTVIDGHGNTNVAAAVNAAVQTANTDTIEVTNFGNGNNSSSVCEGQIITKKDLKEARLKKIRENSQIILVKDLFKA